MLGIGSKLSARASSDVGEANNWSCSENEAFDGVSIDSGVTTELGMLPVMGGGWFPRSDTRQFTFSSSSAIRPAWACRLHSISSDHVHAYIKDLSSRFSPGLLPSYNGSLHYAVSIQSVAPRNGLEAALEDWSR